LWSIITGAASIISLIIAMSDRLPSWKKYISPMAWVLAGFSVGRMSVGMIRGGEQAIQDPRITGILMILICFFIVLYLSVRSMLNVRQDWYAYMIFLLALMFGIPTIMDKYSEIFPNIAKEDYLLLASAKEKNKDLSGAVKYLEKYRDSISDANMKTEIINRIKAIQKQQIGGQ
jgi:hypothetical protein